MKLNISDGQHFSTSKVTFIIFCLYDTNLKNICPWFRSYLSLFIKNERYRSQILERQRQENLQFEASLGKISDTLSQKQNTKQRG
jgi:hypothetical protein